MQAPELNPTVQAALEDLYKSQPDNPVELYKIGDNVICKVLSGDRLNEPEVSTLGQDLGKINSGIIVNIPPPKIPRLIGKKDP